MPTETKSCDRLFAENTLSNAEFPLIPNHVTGFRATAMMILIDGGADPENYIEWSWDGVQVDGKIKCEDHHLAFDSADSYSRIYLRVPAGKTIDYRLFFWIRQR